MIQFQHHFRKIHLLFIHFPVKFWWLLSFLSSVRWIPPSPWLPPRRRWWVCPCTAPGTPRPHCWWLKSGNPPPVDRWFIPLFKRILTSHVVVWDFWTINTTSCFQTQSAKRNIFTSNIVNINWLNTVHVNMYIYIYIYWIYIVRLRVHISNVL